MGFFVGLGVVIAVLTYMAQRPMRGWGVSRKNRRIVACVGIVGIAVAVVAAVATSVEQTSKPQPVASHPMTDHDYLDAWRAHNHLDRTPASVDTGGFWTFEFRAKGSSCTGPMKVHNRTDQHGRYNSTAIISQPVCAATWPFDRRDTWNFSWETGGTATA